MAVNDHEEDGVVDSLVDLCEKQDVKCLIQIGAGDGYEASKVMQHTKCRAIAIEASRSTSCDPNLEYHHAIIGATNGMTMFYLHSNTNLSGHFPRGNEPGVSIEQQRIDTWCTVHGGIKPDALIIDTEGSTMEVLEGCGDLLNGVNLVYAEVQGDEIRPGIRLVGEVDALLSARGLTQHEAMPSYGIGGSQFNLTWIREKT